MRMLQKTMRVMIFEIEKGDEILEITVTANGNGAHINLPKKHIGKNIKVIIGDKRT